jgi:polyisoprenoid-binding protein YceI
MIKKIYTVAALVVVLCISQSHAFGQSKYFTKSADITFDASGPLEDIKAENKKATFVLDSKTGAIETAVLIKAFDFERALMQEHFNENYAESDKYPKSTYKGKITNFSDVDLTKDGSYPIKIDGKLTMHGVTKDVPAKGTIVVKNGKVQGTAKFKVELEDFNIDIPSVVKDKVSKNVNINIAAWLDPLP